MSVALLNVIEFLVIIVGFVWGTELLMGWLDRRAIRKAGK